MNVVEVMKCSAKISLFGIKSWIANRRMLMLLLVIAVTAAQFCAEVNVFARSIDSTTNVFAVFPQLYCNNILRLTIQFGIVLMFSNAPFHRDDSLFCVMRSGYKKWCAGQLIYIVLSSIIYVFSIFLMTIIFSIPTLGFSSTWGKAFATMAQAGRTSGSSGYHILSRIQIQYTPISALLHTMALLLLLTISMGLLIFLLGNLVGRGAGVLASSALILLGLLPDYTQYQALAVRFSPCSLTELRRLDSIGFTRYPNLTYAYIFLGVMALILIAANIFIYSNKRIRFYAYNMDV